MYLVCTLHPVCTLYMSSVYPLSADSSTVERDRRPQNILYTVLPYVISPNTYILTAVVFSPIHVLIT